MNAKPLPASSWPPNRINRLVPVDLAGAAQPTPLPTAEEQRLLWFVREAWPSPATSTELTEGELTDTALQIDIEADGLVAFGDGIEEDHLTLTCGHTRTIGIARQTLHMVG